MAVRKRLSKAQIQQMFTHYGLLYGCVLVYVIMRNPECPDVATRNWIPEWTADVADQLSWLPTQMMVMANPDYQPMFAVKLTGKIEGSE